MLKGMDGRFGGGHTTVELVCFWILCRQLVGRVRSRVLDTAGLASTACQELVDHVEDEGRAGSDHDETARRREGEK
jgi:hypothetical protein